ncbi:MAG: class I SAM-dependent methyltransferase [Xanthobacteraceae bacterium]
MPLTYHPAVFHVNDIAQAMAVIMTPEGSTTAERWEIETPYLADLIAQELTITPDTLLLDYGCGIGRLAYELIQRHNCRVVGVDISPSMRALSVVYTRSDRFMSCSHDMLEGLVARGLRFDAALSLWVLQHCATPAQDIARIRTAIQPDGQLFVVNGVFRSVPTLESGWVNDGLDVKAMLAAEFPLVREGKLAREKTTASLAAHAFWASYRAS